MVTGPLAQGRSMSEDCTHVTDEWGPCANQGSQCGPILERRYATYITTSDIDKLASAGINTLRIPTTYAAWVDVPGSQLYSGNQVSFLKNIATYAIAKHKMHIILDVHSLPGGYSLQTIDAVIDYVQNRSGDPASYTIAPINEPVDNIASFGFPAALTDNGAAWVLEYILAVNNKVRAVNPEISIMFQGSFRPESYWSSKLPSDANIVMDVHNYYFGGRSASGANITEYICQDVEAAAGDGKFPLFIGERSIQAELENTFAGRQKALNTGLYAFAQYTRGSAYWTAKFSGYAAVDGEGTQADYWNYLTLSTMA
ncbi:glycoside hydrolase superfamily [Aspergillus stella-maris]|uniref:glycoside hydrolase superfamily n=1 Tax=Aspergillus stella-maris TaxID=1810926 RepID=UPI003CCD5A2E